MNLQALYDLKERLEHVAIAGTSLLQEDFRLRRAVEALGPLAKANPVFAKIGAGTVALFNAPEAERSTKLLDVLSLVDAVVYTQGTTNISGEMLLADQGTGRYVQVSFGELQPLLTALKGSGSGRTSLIRECWVQHPDYFTDFRVLPFVVGALGDNYGELADLIAEILMKQGASVIPLLKEDFDPAGKTEMARRVRLIAKLAGEEENAWFVTILPDCKKDVREAVIQALSMSKENHQLLLDLCQSERGKLKDAAMRSLAAMDTEEAAAFWNKEMQKKRNTVSCLRGVVSTLAADITALALQTFLEELLAQNHKVYDQADLEQITMLTTSVCGKNSAQVNSMWHWAADHMHQFAEIVPEQNVRSCDFSVAEHLQQTLMQTILWNSDPEVLKLARDLGAQNREWFLGCQMLADMAEVSAKELYERYAPCIVRTGLLKRENTEERNDRIQIMRALSAVRWTKELHSYAVVFPRWDSLTGNTVTSARKLDGVDPRWITLLTDSKINTEGAVFNLSLSGHYRKVEPAMDWVISWLIDGDNPEVCNLAGSWLYRWTKVTGKFNYHFSDLQLCGWKDWKGLLSHCVGKQGEVSYYGIMEWIQRLPISNAEKAEELKKLDLLVQRKEVSVKHGHWPQTLVASQIAMLESDPNAEL